MSAIPVGLALFLAASSASLSASEFGLYLGLRRGRSQGYLDDQDYRTLWIRYRDGAFAVAEVRWLVIPTPRGYLRPVLTTVMRGQQTEERLSLVQVPSVTPLPPATKELQPPENNCEATTYRTIEAASHDALLLRVHLQNFCGGHPEESDDFETVSTEASTQPSVPRRPFLDPSKDSVWSTVRKALPTAKGAIVAPGRRLVVVLTDAALLIKPVRQGNLGAAGLVLPLRTASDSVTREEVVMAEWATPSELQYWDVALEEFLNAP